MKKNGFLDLCSNVQATFLRFNVFSSCSFNSIYIVSIVSKPFSKRKFFNTSYNHTNNILSSVAYIYSLSIFVAKTTLTNRPGMFLTKTVQLNVFLELFYLVHLHTDKISFKDNLRDIHRK